MSENLSALLYLVASICFIMALRGLSSPETARGGNLYGIVGMVIAIVTTLVTPHVVSFWLIIVGILIGGAIGTFIALRIQMTALPQLVAAFHSLVGLAAVCVAAAAFTFPEAYGIGVRGAIQRRQPRRDGARHGDRRHHLHRLDRRLRASCRGWSPAAAGLPRPASAECRARRRAGAADRAVRRRPRRPRAFWLIVLVSLALGFC